MVELYNILRSIWYFQTAIDFLFSPVTVSFTQPQQKTLDFVLGGVDPLSSTSWTLARRKQVGILVY